MHGRIGRSLVQLVVVLALITACRSPVGVEGTVAAWIAVSTLRIENNSSAPVYYFPVERQVAAAINWAPCVEGPSCRVIAPGSTINIPLTEVVGFDSTSREVLVFWWHRVPGRLLNTYLAGDIHSLVVRL